MENLDLNVFIQGLLIAAISWQARTTQQLTTKLPLLDYRIQQLEKITEQ